MSRFRKRNCSPAWYADCEGRPVPVLRRDVKHATERFDKLERESQTNPCSFARSVSSYELRVLRWVGSD